MGGNYANARPSDRWLQMTSPVKMAAFMSEMFWVHVWRVERSGDWAAIFVYVDGFNIFWKHLGLILLLILDILMQKVNIYI